MAHNLSYTNLITNRTVLERYDNTSYTINPYGVTLYITSPLELYPGITPDQYIRTPIVIPLMYRISVGGGVGGGNSGITGFSEPGQTRLLQLNSRYALS